MKAVQSFSARRSFRWVILAMEVAFLILTLMALAGKLFQTRWDMGWSMFFIGLIGSTWSAVFYRLAVACAERNGNGA